MTALLVNGPAWLARWTATSCLPLGSSQRCALYRRHSSVIDAEVEPVKVDTEPERFKRGSPLAHVVQSQPYLFGNRERRADVHFEMALLAIQWKRVHQAQPLPTKCSSQPEPELGVHTARGHVKAGSDLHSGRRVQEARVEPGLGPLDARKVRQANGAAEQRLSDLCLKRGDAVDDVVAAPCKNIRTKGAEPLSQLQPWLDA
mmetsp:Transcript_21023/g.68133  ORF Transcript_21023/g.68133 Transcript_21023/m.68133 type:complete len:202 (+) Transcript_21023:124-729(+)